MPALLSVAARRGRWASLTVPSSGRHIPPPANGRAPGLAGLTVGRGGLSGVAGASDPFPVSYSTLRPGDPPPRNCLGRCLDFAFASVLRFALVRIQSHIQQTGRGSASPPFPIVFTMCSGWTLQSNVAGF